MKISLGAIKNKNVVKLTLGQITSQIADKVVLIGMIWIIVNQFDSKYIPWFLGVGGLPHLLFFKFSPKLIEKIGVVKTLYLTDLLRGALFIVAFYFISLDFNLLWILFALNFLSQMGASFFNPAIFSSASILEDGENIATASALINMSFSLANLIGPLLGLIVYKYFGIETLLLLNGITYLLSGVLEMTIKAVESTSHKTKTVDLEESFYKTNKLIVMILCAFLAINLVLGPITSFIPLYVKEIYQKGIDDLVWLELAMGGGALIAGILLSLTIIDQKIWKKIFFSLFIVSVCYLIFSFSKTTAIGFLSLIVLAFFVEANNLFVLYFFQSYPSSSQVPKVMSLVNLISMASYPLSMALTGILLNYLQLSYFANVLAFLSISIALVIPFIPKIREV